MFKQFAVAATLSLAVSSSFAGGYGYSRFYPAPYIGLDAGSTRLEGKTDPQSSYGLYMGYEFARNFALEVGARRLGEFNECCHELRFEQASVSVIGALPLGRSLKLFGRVGYDKLRTSAEPPHVPTETKSGNLVGWGLSYTFSDTVSARAEVQKPSDQLRNVSIGVSIRY